MKIHSVFSLDLCLNSGQSFAWRREGDYWIGSIRSIGFVLRQTKDGIEYFTSPQKTIPNHQSLTDILHHYFALDENQETVFQTFPKDKFLQEAIGFCSGLRILRQDPWECLAGFILSSTKQITQIQQIWQRICKKWGVPLRITDFELQNENLTHAIILNTRSSHSTFRIPDSAIGYSTIELFSFPTAHQIACCTEKELRACGMGFRAPYLLETAKAVASNKLQLEELRRLPTAEARNRLMLLKGVGRKIADCVLLFSLGKLEAFPIDTWILKVLQKIYFPKKRKVKPQDLIKFTMEYFGPYGGYAQQYLFHYARMNPESLKI